MLLRNSWTAAHNVFRCMHGLQNVKWNSATAGLGKLIYVICVYFTICENVTPPRIIDTRSPGQTTRLASKANAVLSTLSHTTRQTRCGSLILGRTDPLQKTLQLRTSLTFELLSVLLVRNENLPRRKYTSSRYGYEHSPERTVRGWYAGHCPTCAYTVLIHKDLNSARTLC